MGFTPTSACREGTLTKCPLVSLHVLALGISLTVQMHPWHDPNERGKEIRKVLPEKEDKGVTLVFSFNLLVRGPGSYRKIVLIWKRRQGSIPVLSGSTTCTRPPWGPPGPTTPGGSVYRAAPISRECSLPKHLQPFGLWKIEAFWSHVGQVVGLILWQECLYLTELISIFIFLVRCERPYPLGFLGPIKGVWLKVCFTQQLKSFSVQRQNSICPG